MCRNKKTNPNIWVCTLVVWLHCTAASASCFSVAVSTAAQLLFLPSIRSADQEDTSGSSLLSPSLSLHSSLLVSLVNLSFYFRGNIILLLHYIHPHLKLLVTFWVEITHGNLINTTNSGWLNSLFSMVFLFLIVWRLCWFCTNWGLPSFTGMSLYVLEEEAFHRCCQLLLQWSEHLRDDWSWEPVQVRCVERAWEPAAVLDCG